MIKSALFLFSFGLLIPSMRAQAPALTPFKPGRRDVHFQQAAPYSSSDELRRRLFRGPAHMPPYDILKENFQLIIPESYSPQTNWGLFVWVSPSDSPNIPPDWEGALAHQRLLFIGAYKAGNQRNSFDRFRLAVDATYNIRQRLRIDPKRIYVAGFSGGGRVASMLGVGYADIFTGTVLICGVNFYTDLVGEDGQKFEHSYTTDPAMASLAKRNGRFVLLTGQNDPNRAGSKAAYEQGFKKQGFNHVSYLEVPQLGHALPSVDWLEKALDALLAK